MGILAFSNGISTDGRRQHFEAERFDLLSDDGTLFSEDRGDFGLGLLEL